MILMKGYTEVVSKKNIDNIIINDALPAQNAADFTRT